MNSFSEANLSGASRAYAVANTPLFLLRKLREDTAVLEISQSFSADAIYSELRTAIIAVPHDIVTTVRPYVYLVALAMKKNEDYLRQVATLPGIANWDWLEYIRQVLLETSSPVSEQVLSIPAQLSAPTLSIHASSPTQDNKIVLTL